MLDRRVNEMPKKGRVVIANPDSEWPAQKLAAWVNLSYFLSVNVPVGNEHVSVLDLDAKVGVR